MKKQCTTLQEIKCLTNQVRLRTPSWDWGAPLCWKCWQTALSNRKWVFLPLILLPVESWMVNHIYPWPSGDSVVMCEVVVGLDAGRAPTTVNDVRAPSWQSSALNVWILGSCRPKKRCQFFRLGSDARIPAGWFVFLISPVYSALKYISDEVISVGRNLGQWEWRWHLICAVALKITFSLI